MNTNNNITTDEYFYYLEYLILSVIVVMQCESIQKFKRDNISNIKCIVSMKKRRNKERKSKQFQENYNK